MRRVESVLGQEIYSLWEPLLLEEAERRLLAPGPEWEHRWDFAGVLIEAWLEGRERRARPLHNWRLALRIVEPRNESEHEAQVVLWRGYLSETGIRPICQGFDEQGRPLEPFDEETARQAEADLLQRGSAFLCGLDANLSWQAAVDDIDVNQFRDELCAELDFRSPRSSGTGGPRLSPGARSTRRQ